MCTVRISYSCAFSDKVMLRFYGPRNPPHIFPFYHTHCCYQHRCYATKQYLSNFISHSSKFLAFLMLLLVCFTPRLLCAFRLTHNKETVKILLLLPRTMLSLPKNAVNFVISGEFQKEYILGTFCGRRIAPLIEKTRDDGEFSAIRHFYTRSFHSNRLSFTKNDLSSVNSPS